MHIVGMMKKCVSEITSRIAALVARVFAMSAAILLYCLWVIAVNGAIAPDVLMSTTGTALVPLAAKLGGVVLIHHMPGWDEWTIEQVRKIAHHGFACISPHLYFRDGPGSPDDVGARVR